MSILGCMVTIRPTGEDLVMKVRLLFSLAACCVTVGGFLAGAASAHTVELSPYAYYVEYVGGATLYRCAAGSNKLQHAIDIGPSSHTGSHQQYLCSATYNV